MNLISSVEDLSSFISLQNKKSNPSEKQRNEEILFHLKSTDDKVKYN